MTPRTVTLLAATLLVVLQAPARAADPVRIVPVDPSPLAATRQLIDRQFSPLEAFQIQRKLGTKDAGDVSDLSAERLLVRAPAKPAPDGRYGLMIFIDPRKQPRFDSDLNNVLDAHGVVFVSPENAGDDTSAFDRRIPLALHAYEYAHRTYNLDPERIYVAGAAGGSRIAQRLAFTYPDVFTGLVVNSGALELGTQGLPTPTSKSLQLLRAHSRLAFATSAHDQPAFSEQQRSLKSLRTYCVPIARVFDNGHTIAGHAVLTRVLVADVLREFEAPYSEKQQPSPGCVEDLRRTAASELEHIRRLDAGGDHAGALAALVAFDHAYGHLLPDDEIALARRLNPGFFEDP